MAITLSQLRKQYVGPDGSVVPVVDIEHFSLADGEQVALVGSSGSGKTTLLHLIAGILTPDSGKILFNARTANNTSQGSHAQGEVIDYRSARVDGSVDLAQLSEAQRDIFRGRNIGYIFQTHHLLSGFTALENVLLGMSFTGRKHDPAWATRLLNEVGLGERLHYKPQKLSVGQQQRVAVARALANRPKLVLADEPTGALDPNNAQQVLELVRQLCTEVGASLLLVSHDPAITQQFPRVVTLSELNTAATRSPTARLTSQEVAK
jgi:ABC-type lipoprotein export system ATPase subunit